MSLEIYRTYLDGLDLTECEVIELQETLTTMVVNIVDDLFRGLDNDECNQR